ncbi:MAG: hypothetical protein ACREHC_04745 [Candidatus Levyibacteriota bacterium]
MTNNGIVNIHGKDYMTVARRVELAQENRALEGVGTEVLNHNPVVVKAKVTLKGEVYTGISSVSPDSTRQIEKENPYEVAETSAVGRALGFAGYGVIESIASADEMFRATSRNRHLNQLQKVNADGQINAEEEKDTVTCEVCGAAAVERKGTTQGGKQYHGIFCSTKDRSHTRWLWN